MILTLQVLILVAQLVIYATVRANTASRPAFQPARPTFGQIYDAYMARQITHDDAGVLLVSIGIPATQAETLIYSWSNAGADTAGVSDDLA